MKRENADWSSGRQASSFPNRHLPLRSPESGYLNPAFPAPPLSSLVRLGIRTSREKREPGLGVPQPSSWVSLGVPRRPRPHEGRSGRDHLQRCEGGRRGGAEGRGRLPWSRLLCLGKSPVFQVDEVFFFFLKWEEREGRAVGGASAGGWASGLPGGGEEGGLVPAVRVGGGSPSRRAGWCVPSSQEFAAGGTAGRGVAAAAAGGGRLPLQPRQWRRRRRSRGTRERSAEWRRAATAQEPGVEDTRAGPSTPRPPPPPPPRAGGAGARASGWAGAGRAWRGPRARPRCVLEAAKHNFPRLLLPRPGCCCCCRPRRRRRCSCCSSPCCSSPGSVVGEAGGRGAEGDAAGREGAGCSSGRPGEARRGEAVVAGGWLRERPPRTLPGKLFAAPRARPGKGRESERGAGRWLPAPETARLVALGPRGQRWSSVRGAPGTVTSELVHRGSGERGLVG